jgi:hypothetical protein
MELPTMELAAMELAAMELAAMELAAMELAAMELLTWQRKFGRTTGRRNDRQRGKCGRSGPP